MRYLALMLLVLVVAAACTGPSGRVVPRDSVGLDELKDLRDEKGPPTYFAGPWFAGLPLTAAQGWRPENGGVFFGYGTCELPEGEGGCAVPVEIQHFRFRPSEWELAAGCSRLQSLRGVPTARHDGLVLFTGSIVVKVYARDAPEERRVVAELRGLNNDLGPGELLPPPTAGIKRIVIRVCPRSS